MIFDHIGCLTDSIEKSLMFYSIFGDISQIYDITTQGVKVCFCNNIEFIEPYNNEKLTSLYKKGVRFYHIAYKVNNINKAKKQLLQNNFTIINREFKSEAFNNKKCLFLRSLNNEIIELIEGEK